MTFSPISSKSHDQNLSFSKTAGLSPLFKIRFKNNVRQITTEKRAEILSDYQTNTDTRIGLQELWYRARERESACYLISSYMDLLSGCQEKEAITAQS